MQKIFEKIKNDIDFTKNVQEDSSKVFLHYGQPKNAEHSLKVAMEARRLAKRFYADEEAAMICGFLHDIGEIIPSSEMVKAAEELGIEIFEEERQYPIILHQKISKEMASQVFDVKDPQILSAIECHTTLHAEPGTLDMILFIADKIAWDEKYNKLFIDDVLIGLEASLEHGVFAYLKYLLDNRNTLKVLHPWTLQAYNHLGSNI